ncbi:MAG: ASCH domain-containing protein [Candidatus Woesearchaeota archaeon]|nr:ASCH domain-containing protein [Candidatus Woesearchaeota archaeon]
MLLRQPWAELILQGKKTIETRTWNTKFRGVFLIHAAQAINKEWCERFGVQKSVTGAIVGKAEIIGVKEYTLLKDWNADVDMHCFPLTEWTKKRYGFLLANVERIEPKPLKGKLGFFSVPDL